MITRIEAGNYLLPRCRWRSADTRLAAARHWLDDGPKPPRPKEACEYMRLAHRTDLSPAVLRRAAEHVSVRGCLDPAFLLARETLRRWFPMEGR